MNRIYVLYDGDCGLCASVRDWAQQQPQLIPMIFVAANSPQASVLFPSLSRPGQRPEELIVVDDRMRGKKLHEGGRLADVMPTALHMMGIEKPSEMTGKSLIAV